MIQNEPDPLRRIPTKHAAPVHAEIGATLRAARLKRGQSLEAVAQQTRIPKRYLEALENDRYEEFPAWVYLRGFLKSYCEHLEHPFDELWAKLEAASRESSAPGAPAAAPDAPAPAAAAPAPAAPAAPARSALPPAARPEPARPAPSATGALLLAGALAVGLGIWLAAGRKAAPPPAPEPLPKAILPVSRPVASDVVLRAVDDAWVRAEVDGAVVFEGRLPRGARMKWAPKRALVLRTTDASSLRLVVGGAEKALPAPSADGEYRVDIQP
jgi:transcriptional regulator with XRE-family HTH domain